jgi:hypothetical protein
MAVGVRGDGDAIATDEAAEEEKVPMGVFLLPKDSGEDLPGGGIDGGEEDEAGPPVLKPRMMTAVHLHEEAGLRHPLTTAPMPGWTPRAGTADASGAQQALHGFPGYPHALAFRQQFGELVIVHAGIDGPGQGEDPGTELCDQATRGRPAAIAVGEGRGAVSQQAPQEPPEMTRREAQEMGRLPGGQDAVKDTGQEMHALVLSLGQGDRLPGHGRTYSLTHYGRTKSWTYYIP